MKISISIMCTDIMHRVYINFNFFALCGNFVA